MRLKAYVGQGKGYDSATRLWGEHLKDIFGYVPFQGTLNVAIRPTLDEAELLAAYPVIEPFKDFICVAGEMQGVKVHFCYSRRRKTEEIGTFYVISELQLRDALGLTDKAQVEIELTQPRTERADG